MFQNEWKKTGGNAELKINCIKKYHAVKIGFHNFMF